MGQFANKKEGKGPRSAKARGGSVSKFVPVNKYDHKSNTTDYVFCGGDAGDWAMALPTIRARLRIAGEAWDHLDLVAHPEGEIEFTRLPPAENAEEVAMITLMACYEAEAERESQRIWDSGLWEDAERDRMIFLAEETCAKKIAALDEKRLTIRANIAQDRRDYLREETI